MKVIVIGILRLKSAHSNLEWMRLIPLILIKVNLSFCFFSSIIFAIYDGFLRQSRCSDISRCPIKLLDDLLTLSFFKSFKAPWKELPNLMVDLGSVMIKLFLSCLFLRLFKEASLILFLLILISRKYLFSTYCSRYLLSNYSYLL